MSNDDPKPSGRKFILTVPLLFLLTGCPWLLSPSDEALHAEDQAGIRPNQKVFDPSSVRVATLAGNPMPSSPEATASSPYLYSPKGVTSDGRSFFASFIDSRIFEFVAGSSRLVAGKANHVPYVGFEGGFSDGHGEEARFNLPVDIRLLPDGDLIVADTFNHRIRRVTRQGLVTTLAGNGNPGGKDGSGMDAEFDRPSALAVDAHGNIYVGEEGGHRIRRITPDGQVSTIAGSGRPGFADGPGLLSMFNTPLGLAVDRLGNLFVADTKNYRIRRISPDGIVTTVAGTGSEGFHDGPAEIAKFEFITGLAIDQRDQLFISDLGAHCIRKLSPNGQVTTLVGGGNRHLQHARYDELNEAGDADGDNLQARFESPGDLSLDPDGNLWVADMGNDAIRKITFTN
jgi:sugar lactone lactonase YvrE